MITDDFDTLLEHCQHPYLRVVPWMDFERGFIGPDESIAAIFRLDAERQWLLGLGPYAGALVVEAQSALRGRSRWTLPRADEHLLGEDRSRWDWWVIDRPMSNDIDLSMVLDLGLDHDSQIAEFLKTASPTASSSPGDSEIATWHGVVEAEKLIAVGAAIRWKSGAPVLASIATDPDHRGRGLARAITASLTNYFFTRGEAQVSLGMYAANESARRTYTAVGYRVVEEFTSGTMD